MTRRREVTRVCRHENLCSIRPIGVPGARHVMQIMHVERRINLCSLLWSSILLPLLSVSCQLVVQGEQTYLAEVLHSHEQTCS